MCCTWYHAILHRLNFGDFIALCNALFHSLTVPSFFFANRHQWVFTATAFLPAAMLEQRWGIYLSVRRRIQWQILMHRWGLCWRELKPNLPSQLCKHLPHAWMFLFRYQQDILQAPFLLTLHSFEYPCQTWHTGAHINIVHGCKGMLRAVFSFLSFFFFFADETENHLGKIQGCP